VPELTFVNFMFDGLGIPITDTVYDGQILRNMWGSKSYTEHIFGGIGIVEVNIGILEAVRQILEVSSSQPVIILQGDHGTGQLRSFRDDETKGGIAEFEMTGIINAFYLPDYCREAPYPGITPVNTFRWVFNACLGGEFDLLEDKFYWSFVNPNGSRDLSCWTMQVTPIDFSETDR
jgi:hypothetical protein